MTTQSQDIIERLERASGPDRCWEWPRSTDDRGRGRIWVNGKIMLAHRAVWEFLRGPIPAGNGRAKLTADQARAIRESADSMRSLARRFGISDRTVKRIKVGEIWKN